MNWYVSRPLAPSLNRTTPVRATPIRGPTDDSRTPEELFFPVSVANTLKRLRIADVTLRQKQDLAAVIQLCGAGAGEIYARRRFRQNSGQRCGDHDVQAYVARVDAVKRVFEGLDARGPREEER